MALPLYAATLFISAFILFLVQPMIGKMILPKLGGTPQVWNTCMVFFQTILLAGYAYTHFVSTRLKLKQQLMVHSVLIALPFLVLLPWRTWGLPLPEGPFNLTDWVPDLGVNPIGSALYILLVIVGLPFFVVSTTAPLLQKWFASTGHPAARDPYFLYGASNLGSMLALLFYPFIIEPNMVLYNQALLWTGGFALLFVTVYACVAMVWKPAVTEHPVETMTPPTAPPATETPPADKPVDTAITAKPPVSTAVKPGAPRLPSVSLPQTEEMTMLRRLKWIGLAAVPSSMMLGITTHITTDLSPVPMIWLIPLTLYLLSFILVFARWPVVWTEEPHKVMVYLQPIFIAMMLISDFMNVAHGYLRLAIFFDVAGFFFTTMVCHGELAKDRPSTRYLTEFYLMMSIGGMLGGMFNGLFAPNVPYMFEFPSAVIAAALLRPTLTQGGWIATFVAGLIDPTAGEGHAKKGKGQRPHHGGEVAVGNNLALTLDIALAVATGGLAFILYQMTYNPQDPTNAVAWGYGVTLTISIAMLFRPVRYGLAIALIILIHAYTDSQLDRTEFRVRGYFGLIKVSTALRDEKVGPYKQMIHGHINHGMNFIKPKNEADWGNPTKDYSRHATTYYHRWGPAGIVMERFRWSDKGKDDDNKFHSDARIGGSLIGQIAPSFGMAVPTSALVDLWSEPAYATIGLGTGTMAGYARPYQHMHYYEIDNLVKRLSLRKTWSPSITYLDDLNFVPSEKNSGHFTYLRDALARGVHIQVLMGDARLRMAMPYKSHYEDWERGGGPTDFYHMMVVDAFSSDAIPAHLITKQAIAMYFDRLREDGVLCVHTSNRFVDLVKVVADVAGSLDAKHLDQFGRPLELVARRGHDSAPYNDKIGHFTSEWVMVYRKTVTDPNDPERRKRINNPWGTKLFTPPGWADAARKKGDQGQYWTTPEFLGRYIWTDDFYNILGVMR